MPTRSWPRSTRRSRLTDNKGRKVGVPADKVAYIEVSKDDETKRVGFSR
jgi:hypothetical protein